jgi:hypothetical protein
MGYIRNSSNPSLPNSELFREHELGLDYEEIDYILENNMLQLRVGGDPFYIFTRSIAGDTKNFSISDWETTTPLYSAYIWRPANGEVNHPNIRHVDNTISVRNGIYDMNRVYDKNSLHTAGEFAVEKEIGIDSATAGSIKVWFGPGFTPLGTIVSYSTICPCVDVSTGYPNRECPICMGTQYPVAYTQQLSSATAYTPSNTFLIRVPMKPEDRPVTTVGRVIRRDLSHWMLPEPYVNNYDIIMGTRGDTKNKIWEVTQKSDSRWRGVLTHQQFETIRIEESDIRYRIVVNTLDPDA